MKTLLETIPLGVLTTAATHYCLSIGQIYLPGNPPPKRPLRNADEKRRRIDECSPDVRALGLGVTSGKGIPTMQRNVPRG